MGEPRAVNAATGTGTGPTGSASTTNATVIALRQQIDGLDSEIIRLCADRLRLSRQIIGLRLRDGEPPVVPERERDILMRYRAALGPAGDELASLLLRAGRGPV